MSRRYLAPTGKRTGIPSAIGDASTALGLVRPTYRGGIRSIISLTAKSTLMTITASLAEIGRARCPIDDLYVDALEWPALAREAACHLGLPVESIETADEIAATLTDWPRYSTDRAPPLALVQHTVDAMENPTPAWKTRPVTEG